MNSQRLILIGLDGATFDLLQPWIDAGKLPTLQSLTKGGVSGPLQSTIPPVTPVAWTSMVTGANPGKHGITGFTKRKDGSYEVEPYNAQMRQVPPVWEILSQAGKKVIVFNVPFTYPPDPVNGIMISGMGTPNINSDFVYPPELRDTLLKQFGPYQIDAENFFLDPSQTNLSVFEDELFQMTEQRIRVANYLMDTYPWDFFMMVFLATDRAQHILWQYVDANHPNYNPAEAAQYSPLLLKLYQYIDSALADLLTKWETSARFMIASDHGFGSIVRSLAYNAWLRNEGFGPQISQTILTNNPTLNHLLDWSTEGIGTYTVDWAPQENCQCAVLGVGAINSYAGVHQRITGLRPGFYYEVRASAKASRTNMQLEIIDLDNDEHPIIDGGIVSTDDFKLVTARFRASEDSLNLSIRLSSFNGTDHGEVMLRQVSVVEQLNPADALAYVLPGDVNIFVNLLGREPNGKVRIGQEYNTLCQDIIDRLSKIKYPGTDVPFVSAIHLRDELYSGPFVDDAPDIVFLRAEAPPGLHIDERLDIQDRCLKIIEKTPLYRLFRPLFREKYRQYENRRFFINPPAGWTGNHRQNGVFVYYGYDLKPNYRVALNIMDVSALVLHHFGLPIPTYMDAQVPVEIFATPTQVSYVEKSISHLDETAQDAYSDQDRQEVEDRLRSLGYLS